MHKIAVYLGPSLEIACARSILDAEYLSPIRRGDLAKLGPEVRCVGIVDGEFYQSLAVSPKEILPLLERGVRVYGASSMGALRAAELYSHGMIGVGKIFEWYRDGLIDADDEVALTCEAETFRPLSEPLINIRVALREAVHRGLLGKAKADETIEAVRAVYFPDRSYNLVRRLCPELGAFPETHRRSQKADDAVLLLRTIAVASDANPGG